MTTPSERIAIDQIEAISLVVPAQDLDTLGVTSLGFPSMAEVVIYMFLLKNPQLAGHVKKAATHLKLYHRDRTATTDCVTSEVAQLQREFTPCGIYVQMPMLNNTVTVGLLTVVHTAGEDFIAMTVPELLPTDSR